MNLRFVKMHGLGNDYVYVDCFAQSLNGIDPARLSVAISDRHRGVGSDGLILMTPPSPGVAADVRMEMYNADGSRGAMCGNGIRCVAKYAVERGLVRPRRDNRPATPSQAHGELPLSAELNSAMAFLGESLAASEITAHDVHVETDRGVLELVAFAAGGIVRSVRVDMGPPILDPARIPVVLPRPHEDRLVAYPLDQALPLGPPAAWMEDCGLHREMTCVSMGNPHVVIPADRVDAVPLETVGPLIERQPIFPQRINVHFAQVLSRGEIAMRTWERGSGATLACGTGACAVLVAKVLEGRADRAATIHLPGGDLRIEWPESGHVFMTGPAEEVFTGEWRG